MYICSNCIFVIHIPYILYTVTYTLHYIAYMVILSFCHVNYIVLVRYEGGMGSDPSPLEGWVGVIKRREAARQIGSWVPVYRWSPW